MEVIYVDLSESCKDKETIMKTVSNIATLSYGNDYAKNPEVLFNRLVNDGHLSVLEFIRCPYIEDGIVKGTSIQESYRFIGDKILERPYNPELHKKNIFTFKIKAPIFVARQFMRHRCFSYLEMSRRYTKHSKVPFEFYLPEELDQELSHIVKDYYSQAINLYELLLSHNIKPEIARIIIPQSAYTIFYAQADKPCLENFFKLRLDKHAQKEIRFIAEKMYEVYKNV